MGRNLYILAGTLGGLGLLSLLISFSSFVHTVGSPSDAPMWRMMGIGLILFALMSALGATLSSLFEQADRRAADQRQRERTERRQRRAR
ncbi:hypothetical protein SAMN05421819_3111 [Bryocella elongata]|uniref:Uncharacterized protein n=1 Tax=Bryocella elongata TaxID=863522 RepID=A0A1H6AGJ5_9BACT|nr:hypothetical protein [Bryocella elongata]SEG47135.1 hypothetical protein SAMN05421819_3111 [Bryocella elongata]